MIPFHQLTPTEHKVARLMGVGYDYARIGELLAMSEATVSWHVSHIAGKLPNPDALKPQLLVTLWAAHQRWLEDYRRSA